MSCYPCAPRDAVRARLGSVIRFSEDAVLPETLPHPDLVAALPRLRRYARVLTGDAARADDLVQDTLARAWEKRRLWQAGTDLRAWLFTVMHNVYVNQLALIRRDEANVSLDADTTGFAWQLPVRGKQADRVELMEEVEQIGRRSAEPSASLLLSAGWARAAEA